MHSEAYQYVERTISRFPLRKCVIEYGSRNINGSVRPLFIGSEKYFGLDVQDGPGVDIVCDALSFDPDTVAPGLKVDTVVCTEMLEHASNISGVIQNAYRTLEPGGLLIITAVTDPREAHSAVDGGPLRPDEHYRNVSPAELAELLSGFTHSQIEIYHSRGDIYAVALK